MNEFNHWNKALRVVRSCQTLKQLTTAINYVNQAFKIKVLRQDTAVGIHVEQTISEKINEILEER